MPRRIWMSFVGVLIFSLIFDRKMIGNVAGIGTVITACCLGPLIEYCNVHISQKILNH